MESVGGRCEALTIKAIQGDFQLTIRVGRGRFLDCSWSCVLKGVQSDNTGLK
jgi:hypothetical protein